MLQRFALDILNVTQIALHGGSLLVTLGHAGSATPDPSVAAALLEEDRVGMTCAAYYEAFAADVHTLRATLTDTLSTLKAQGHSIAGYGAAAKATILLNFMEIGQEQIDYVADRSPHKQGRTIPGVRIPIRSPKSLIQDNPDYVVILAWNFKEEIIGQLAEYSTNGGRFIIPSPKVELV